MLVRFPQTERFEQLYQVELVKLELPSAIASSNSYAFLVLSKLPACIHISIDAR